MNETEINVEFQKEILFLNSGLDLKNRILTIEGEINDEMAGGITRAIGLMKKESNDPITVNIRSFGGCVYSGLAIYDALESSGLHITTVNTGFAMSMGFVLFLVGNKRLCMPRSTFMAHNLSAGVMGNLDDMQNDMKESKRLNNYLMGIIVEKTDKSKKYWNSKMKSDFYFGKEDAQKLGIIVE